MKKLLLLCSLMCAAIPLFAQKVYFIYIESESRNPFYVKMGEKVISSSGTGYLILSRLRDSTYGFQLGPSPNEGEQRFEVSLSGKDRGFLLKKFNDGWGLFDLQSLEVVRPAGSGIGMDAGNRLREDRFSALLSQAAGDTTLLYQPVVAVGPANMKRKNEEKPAPVKEVMPTPTNGVAIAPENKILENSVVNSGSDSSNVAPETVAEKAAEKPVDTVTVATVREITSPVTPVDSGSSDPVFKRSVVTRRSESSTVEGFGLVYLDEADGAVDTIRLVIPNAKVVFSDPTPVAEKEPEMTRQVKAGFTCNGQAGEKEFFKLRRNLASIDSEADMTQAAVEVFRKRCFSVDQVKNLSTLFLTQGGKYAFLEAAYPYVFNREQFAALQSEIFDPAYLARFKALTSN